MNTAIKLEGVVQHYSWGRRAESSLVADLAHQSFDPSMPCAELWLGTHPNGAATAIVDGYRKSLPSLLAAESSNLPFLLKVLSIASPLSIQTHPDRNTAAKLHARDPEHYPDSNHKPEIAFALSDLSLLYGFRSSKEIQEDAMRLLPLQRLLGSNPAIGDSCRRIFGAAETLIVATVTDLVADLSQRSPLSLSPEDTLFLSLNEQFGSNDPGTLSPYFMNIAKVPEGSCIYIAENKPHAYLSGDVVECMANSDNVVRAGLTKKYRDIDTLLDILNYSPSPISEAILIPNSRAEGVNRYCPPCKEFQLEMHNHAPDPYSVTPHSNEILLCIEGSIELTAIGLNVPASKGEAFLIPQGMQHYNIDSRQGRLVRAFAVD